ncbi:hypothetical protein TNCV_2573991 [Trichonephila clavipes]|nr:hypothetical protein TNCV_2573991 [Trichonephila clavipes]
MVKIYVALRCRIPSIIKELPSSSIRANYEQLSEFEGGRIIGLKEADWTNRRIACHTGQNDATIIRGWQE